MGEGTSRCPSRPLKVSIAALYWFDDSGSGGASRAPASWRVLYRLGEEWEPVEAAGAYGVAVDRFNEVRFKPVETGALRLEVKLQPNWTGGVLEWRVDR